MKAVEQFLDGRLTAREALDHRRFDAGLVTLSACERAIEGQELPLGVRDVARVRLPCIAHPANVRVEINRWARLRFTDKDIAEFQSLFKKETGKDISKEKAAEYAERMIRFLQMLEDFQSPDPFLVEQHLPGAIGVLGFALTGDIVPV